MIFNELSIGQKKIVSNSLTVASIFGMIFVFSFALYYSALAIGEWRGVKRADTFSLNVEGEAKRYVKPDVAVLTLTVRTQNANLSIAKSENDKKSNAVADFIKSKGVKDEDLKTVNYQVIPQEVFTKSGEVYNMPMSTSMIYPPFPPTGTERRIVSYEVINSLEVRVRDTDSNSGRLEEILGGAVGAGANEVNGPNFEVGDIEKIRKEVEAMAIENARENANLLAQKLGVRITRIIGYGGGGGFYYSNKESRAVSNIMSMDASISSAPNIEVGQNEISATVTVTYEARD